MTLDAEQVLGTAQSRMAANAPGSASAIEGWFQSHHARLIAWARVANGTAMRLGASLRSEAAPSIVEQLIGRLGGVNPEEAAWGRRYQGLLELLVRVIIDAARESAVIPSTAPLELPTKASERLRINLLASQIAASPNLPTTQDLEVLRQYTGFGGLSLERVADQLPAELVPDTKALVDEFYTMPEVCAATAQIIATLTGSEGLSGPALEPAAGIGRFVGAFRARPDMAKLRWTAVEYSALSARILGKLYPDVSVVNSPFEKWIADHFNEVAGTLSLAVTNPPYGRRGKNKYDDPDKSYREDLSYPYFVRRTFDLLKGGGIGVALVPYGFLSGHTPVHTELRRKVLLRHHLLIAYRLPSSIYSGAEIVTDLSFWRARGGELTDVQGADQFVLSGDYFSIFPGNILGREETSPRGRYQVIGDFIGLPTQEVREDCPSCSVRPFIRALVPVIDPEEGLDTRLKVALVLAKRVNQYLDLAGSSREVDKQRALDLHPELTAATSAWLAFSRHGNVNYTPAEDKELNKAAGQVAALAALLSVFEPNGALKSAFLTPPRFEPVYQGVATIIAHAEWLFEKRRTLTIKELRAFRIQQGLPEEKHDDLVQELASQGWCEDWREDGESVWLPPNEYYSGDLWPRFRRAKTQATPRALAQLAKIRQLLGTVTLEEASPTLRDSWVPAEVIQNFLTENLKLDIPPLHWFRALLKPVGVEYHDIAKLEKRLQIALGYINHDLGYFAPDYKLETDPGSGEEETNQQALDRVRLAYGAELTRTFRNWLDGHPRETEAVFDAYALAYRGYIAPTYGLNEVPIARWGKRIQLKPHQRAGAWRLIRNNGGLLAFDVGVGKTYTGIATLSYLRQIGRARRPVIVVPNTIVWKWKNEITRALPDYRVIVIGSERYVGRGGLPKARLDEKAERLQKWSEFKLGLYDVAIVAYSVLSKTHVTEESLRQFLEETPTLLREVGFKTDNLHDELEKLSDLYEQRRELSAKIERLQEKEEEEAKKNRKQLEEKAKRLDKRLSRLQAIADRLSQLSNASERNRAILQESINEWIAGIMEAQQDSDGLEWESLKVDLLLLDEAQNMKNLWTVGRREGGVPKYLGAISEGSDRAFDFAVRAFLTQKEAGGSGVVLLSATPAKNSPLEFYTLLGFVDHYCWTKRGILDPDYFIDRYLRLQMRSSLKPNGKVENRTAVVGFMALNELRDIVFKYGDFKTAADVGLVLPESKTRREFIPMNEEQRRAYQRLRGEYEEIVSSREGMREKHKLLGLLQMMALVALHPELEHQPKEGWTWDSAARHIKSKSSPKLAKAVAICREKPDCGHIIFCDNIAVHRCLVDLLVEAGVRPERIAVLNAERAPTGLKRQEIADGFNGTPTVLDPETGRIEQEGTPPIYDIVIANAVAYEGIDLQVRTCRVIHLDLPYEPATLQQRNGRAVRQFNTQSVVEIIYLLSDKSYDAIKLVMITGKLRWMSDILKGTDRETSNPAADMDMDTDDFLLMLADDPEAAKQAMEAVRKRNELERKAQAAFQAWLRVGQLIGKVKTSESSRDEGIREQARQEALELQRYLQAVPADTWPWVFVADRVLTGISAVTVAVMEEKKYSFRAVWEGLGLLLSSGSYIYFGAIRYGGFSYRELGSHEWKRAPHDAERWAILAEVPPSDFLVSARDDRAQWVASLEKAVESLRLYNREGLKAVGLFDAPDAWATEVWGVYGPQIVGALSRRGVEIPQRAGQSVSFSSDAAGANVLPPTEAGFEEFLRRVAAGRFTFGEMQDRAKAWWNRDFPKGVADDREIQTIVGLDGEPVARRREAGYRGMYSVIEVPSEDRSSRTWAIAGLPEGRQLDLEPFFNLDNAKLAARWLAELRSNESSFNAYDIGSRRKAIVTWIAEQVDLPTLASVQARYAAGIG